MLAQSRFRLLVALPLAALLLAATVVAVDAKGGRPFHVTLTGAAEVPAGDSDGSGEATFWMNPGRERVCWTFSVANIDAPVASHIHAAPAGQNGRVVIPIGTAPSGCVEADRELILDIFRNPEQYYFNVHNAAYPGGAVRGQLGTGN